LLSLFRRPFHWQLIWVSGACLLLTATAALLIFAPATAGMSAQHADALRLRAIVAISVAAVAGLGLSLAVGRHWQRSVETLDEAIGRAADDPIQHEGPGSGICLAPTQLPADLAHLGRRFDRLRMELEAARLAHRSSQQTLAARTAQMDRLLEFSQTIQGAGQTEQIFTSLGYYLRTELSLAGLTVLTHDAEGSEATAIKACWPERLMCGGNGAPREASGACGGQAVDLDAAMCPCLRQNLPRHFRADGSPVRCAVDTLLSPAVLAEAAGTEIKDPAADAPVRILGIAEYPAYCVPFSVGRKMQSVVHMLLPPGEEWTEARRHLAQTYINTAQSSLVSLTMLGDAEKQSMTDPLTGLYNRRSMEQLLQREVALSERHGHPLSIVMIDLDHFKQINDGHGHAIGDHLLRAFADCVRITLRRTDLAFRYGGDEFAIALPQTPLSQAQQVVQKLRQAFASIDFADAIANLSHQPTLSIGVAERSKATNVLTLANLLAAADQALYDAKNANRNCVRVYQPPQAA
jgi:diguanylate cyclase (GGDEF)-like protein